MFVKKSVLALFQIVFSLRKTVSSSTQYEIAATLAIGDKSPCTTVLFGLDYQWISVREFIKHEAMLY